MSGVNENIFDMLKPQSATDPQMFRMLIDALKQYIIMIPLLDNDSNQYIRDIGIDFRDNLNNIKRLIEILESNYISDLLVGNKENPLIHMSLMDIEKTFKKFGLGE